MQVNDWMAATVTVYLPYYPLLPNQTSTLYYRMLNPCLEGVGGSFQIASITKEYNICQNESLTIDFTFTDIIS